MRLGAQEMKSYTREEMEQLVNPPLLERGDEILRFDSCRQYIGKLSESDAPRTCSFSFCNAGRSEVTITHITTSCGCTGASFDKSPVLPGERRIISLTYHPKNRVGTIDTQAFVYTTLSDSKPVAKLTLWGEVTSSDEWRHLPYAMGALRVKRKETVIREVTPNRKPSVRILCGNSGTTNLKLSARMLPVYATFRTEPMIILPGMEADLVITVDGSKLPAGKRPLHFRFLIEGANGRPSERTVSVTIEDNPDGETQKQEKVPRLVL